MSLRNLLLIVLFVAATLVAAPAPCLSVVVSGETHAMLHPCDCPTEPGGGVAQRATLLKDLRDSAEVLLLDAGGFAGGGPYDQYTAGRAADSLRSAAMLRAMGAMHYDAVGVGDDDLLYGVDWLRGQAEAAGVPLICANLTDRSARLLFEPYRIIKKKGVSIAVTAVVTPERLFPLDTELVTLDPVGVLDSLVSQMVKQSEYQVLICHGGEELSVALARRYPDFDLVVNGHRKQSAAPVVATGGAPVVHFGFQGKALARTVLGCDKGAAGEWLSVGPHLAPDSAVAALLDTAAVNQLTFDLYIMSQCPYGVEAVSGFSAFVRQFPGVDWSVWFIGEITESTSLKSLRGENEIHDEKQWLAVQALYPQRWLEFLSLRSESTGSTPELLEQLQLDTLLIGNWVRERGDSVLAMHYRRSMRLGVNASPTLYVNNGETQMPPTRHHLARMACGSGIVSPLCDSLPECLEDSDCRRAGYDGRCEQTSGEPRCSYTEAVAFDFIVLAPSDSLGADERAAIATTNELFAAARVVVAPVGDSLYTALFARYTPPGLPFYLFGKSVNQTPQFERVESGLVDLGDHFTFRPGIMRLSFFPSRKRTPGSVALIVDPLAESSRELVAAAAASGLLDSWEVLPLVVEAPGSDPLSDRLRVEEAGRWVALRGYNRDAFARYLAQWAQDKGLTEWATRLDRRALRALAKVPTAKRLEMVKKVQTNSAELGLREPALLIDNQHLLFISAGSQIKAFASGRSAATKEPGAPAPR